LWGGFSAGSRATVTRSVGVAPTGSAPGPVLDDVCELVGCPPAARPDEPADRDAGVATARETQVTGAAKQCAGDAPAEGHHRKSREARNANLRAIIPPASTLPTNPSTALTCATRPRTCGSRNSACRCRGDQYRRGGVSRWLIRRAMADRPPPEILGSSRRGVGTADWFERL
jgi:hypothetical protein